ncbi:MAG TPA: alpha-hydroxy acid oxidase [Alphaproteobacteria bacterium]|nr:alpha-hydroxy acid oxidase [Alphaproteobacteria bacterium]
MNERFDSELADTSAEPVGSIETPELRRSAMVKSPLLAQHPGRLKAAAKRRLPIAIYDFLEGGSNDEVTLKRNRDDFDALRLRQRVFDHAATRNMRTVLFGQRSAIPVALAPIGMGGVFYPRAEIHAARAASAFGVPYCLSTLASCSIEEVAAAVETPFLFQLYMMKDRAINAALLQRAEQAKCPGLVVNVDTAVQGRRNRDLDNGLVVPLKVRPRHVARIVRKPRWLYNWVRNKPTLGNLAPYSPDGTDLATVSMWAEPRFKGSVTAADLEWLRHHWPRKLIVKGVLDPEDAKLALGLGVDTVIISNHGGRQLDGAASTIDMLPRIRDAVGDKVELLLDSGVRSGFDVLKALGRGANGCLLGRAYVYGLAAHGEPGVTAALELIAQELDEAMTLTGTADVNALPENLVFSA